MNEPTQCAMNSQGHPCTVPLGCIQQLRAKAANQLETLGRQSQQLQLKSAELNSAISSFDAGLNAYLRTGLADMPLFSLTKAMEQLTALVCDREDIA